MAVAKPLPMRHLPWLLVDDEDGTDVFTDGSEPLLIVQDLSNPQPKLLVLGVSCAQRLDLYDHLRGTRPPGNIEGSGIAVPRPENFVTRFLSEIRKLVLKHSVRDGRAIEFLGIEWERVTIHSPAQLHRPIRRRQWLL